MKKYIVLYFLYPEGCVIAHSDDLIQAYRAKEEFERENGDKAFIYRRVEEERYE